MRKRSTGIAAIILLTVFAIGCGETFRPIAIPQPQPGGDPNSLRHAIVVAKNPGIIAPGDPDPNCTVMPCHGSTSNINTTGDTNIGNVVVGIEPVHAGFVSTSFTYTANPGDNTVTRYLTGSPATAPVTIPMPTNCDPNYIMSRNTGTAYVACAGNDTVAVMNVGLDSIVTTVNVGSNPTALDEKTNGSTVYSLNSGDGTITVIATIDNNPTGTIAVGGSPVWSVSSADGARLFVANASGYVSVIDTTSNTLTTNIPVGANPTFLVFDPSKLRVYVVNQGGNSISVIDANPANVAPAVVPATYLTVVKTISVGTDPRSVTALPDGTKVYVANCGSNGVSVINTISLAVTKTITTGTCPISLASPSDSSRVIVGVKGAGAGDVEADPPQILTISTQSDAILVTLKPAQQNTQCAINPAGTPAITYCPLQQPVWVTMAP